MKKSILAKKLSVMLLSVLASTVVSQAASITTTNADAAGATYLTSSFTAKGFWNTNTAPSAGNDYFSSVWGMRTPQDTTNYTFQGNSLTLQAPTTTGYSLLEGATVAKTLTINNFTNAGGIIRSRGGHTLAVTIAGNMFAVAANSTILADQNGWIIRSPLVGTDTVVLTNSPNSAQAQDTISYQGTNSGFTGTLLLNSGITRFQNIFSGPGNPATFNARQITLNNNATFQDEVGLSLTNGRGGITLGGGATINTATAGSNTLISVPIAGAFTLTKSGAGTLTLAGSNAMTGLTLSGASVGSRLNINSTNALGIGNFTIQNCDNATIDNTSGSAVTLLANNTNLWNNNFTFAGSNPLHLGNGPVTMAANRTLTINNSTLTVGGIISSAGFSLVKAGGGTLALGGASTYSGATTINGGSLVLNSGGSIANSPSISLAAGTTFDVSAVSFVLGTTNSLIGSGTVNGSVADSNGSQIIPAGSGTVGTLTMANNLTLAGDDILRFDFATGSNDLISVGGNLTPNGNTAISLGTLPTVLPSGTYTLIQVAGSLGGSAANFYVTNQPTPSRQGFSIVYATSPNRVQLQVTGNSAPLEWLGTSTVWDLLTTPDWTNSATASADVFYNGDAVSFTDLGVAAQPVLNTTVSPGAVTFNSAGNYLLSGTGAINGGGGLTKAGNSILTITTTNGYIGVTAINGGTVSVNMFTNAGIAQPLGAGSTASGNLTFNGGQLQYTGDNSSSTRGATINSGGGTVDVVAGTTTLSINGAIAGSSGGALTKIGNGTLALGGANSYNGSTFVNVGTLSSSGAIPDTSATVLADFGGVSLNLLANDTIGSLAGGGANGGNITLNGFRLTHGGDNANTTYGGVISGTGGITKVGAGTHTLIGANSFTGSFFVKNGRVEIDSGGGINTTAFQSIGVDTGDNATLTLKGSGTLAQTTSDFNVGDIGNSIGTLNIQDNASLSVNAFFVASANATGSTASGTVNQTGGSVTETATGAGTFLLGGRVSALGVGTYNLSGGTLTAAGGLRVGSAGTGIFNQSGGTFNANGGVNIARLGGSTGTYHLNGGTLATLNVTSSTGTNAVLNLNGGTLQAIATANNTVWINNLTTANVRTNPTTIDNGSFNVTISQPLVHSTIGGDAAVDGGLIFQGAGTNTLSGTNTYNGPTVVNSGVLNVNGSIGTGAVSVFGGLSGNGLVGASVTIQSGAVISPGSPIGTLSAASVALQSGSSALFNFGVGSNSVLAVSGTLTLGGPVTVNIGFINANPAVGTYNLIAYGSLSGSFANLTIATTNPRYAFSLTNDTLAKIIKLVVSGVPGALTWRGDGGFNGWDNAGSYQNWRNGATPDFFFDGDVVTFNNTGSNTPAINLTTVVSPGSITVTSTNDYDFVGGGIAGPGGLVKNSTGKLTLEGNNTYVGATVINGGTVQVGNATTTGTLGSGGVTNGGTLIFNRGDALVVANSIDGSGSIRNQGANVDLTGNITGSASITQEGTGSLSLNASNSYTGLTLVSSSTLYPRNGNALGDTASGTTISPGATMYIDTAVNIGAEPLTLNGVGDGGGALRKGGASVSIFGGPITLASDSTINIDGGATLNLTNASGIAAADLNLTMGGPGAGTVTGPIALGLGGVTKEGTGSWTVSTNTYSGVTTINNGILRIGAQEAFGTPPGIFTPGQVLLNAGELEGISDFTINGNSGITVGAATIGVDAGTTMTIANPLQVNTSLTKSRPGTLILSGNNTISGTLYIDTASITTSDGAVRITSINALGGFLGPIVIRNNNGGSSTLQLDGTTGNIVAPQDFTVNCRGNNVATIQNIAGNNTLSGFITLVVGGNSFNVQSDAGLLTISGNSQYLGDLTGARSYNFSGPGDHLITGQILNSTNGAPISLTKAGAGTLTLAAANTYSNSTTVTAGTLKVTGSINSAAGVSVTGGTLTGNGIINDLVAIGAGGTLAPGNSGIGTLTVNGNLSLAGVVSVEVNKTAGTSDKVSGVNTLQYGGTLVVTNLAGALTLGSSFQLFTAAAPLSNFSAISGSPGAGLAWSFNPTNGTLNVVSGMAANPTNITYSVGGGSITLSWPADHQGWILQTQTNSLALGLRTNWFDIAGTASSTQAVINVSSTNPAVFFRLRSP
jgi:fibronectin-binding autotransporter adhesin